MYVAPPRRASGKASRGGVILLTIIAICYLLSSPFVMVLPGTPQDQMTLRGTLHGIFGALVFILMPASCFVFLRRFREDPEWQFLQGWTLALGTISTAAVVVQTIAEKTLDTLNLFTDWLGLIQRAAIIPFMIWLFVFALGILRKNADETRDT